MPCAAEALEGECREAVEDGGGGEGNGAVVVVYGNESLACGPVPVLDHLGEIAYTVCAYGCIAFESEPVPWGIAAAELDAHAVAAAYVGGQVLAYVALFACLYELVAVQHGIQVCADVPVIAGMAVAYFYVMHALGLGVGVCAVVGVVVALGLAVAKGVAGVCVM